MYPFERFTERAKKVLTLAQEEAERSHHSYIGTEHLLLGLLREGEGLAAKVLNNLGVEIGQLAIVAAFLPLAFCLRGSWVYQRLTFHFGSAVIALLAATWMMERIFDFKWLPF